MDYSAYHLQYQPIRVYKSERFSADWFTTVVHRHRLLGQHMLRWRVLLGPFWHQLELPISLLGDVFHLF